MLESLIIYITSFALIWFGSGLIVSSTSKFSEKLKLSPFIFSFVLLGLLTSAPELSIGLQAVADNDPEIFVGNLIGGIAVIFLLIIPVLAIFGNGINIKRELDRNSAILALGVILAPAILALDGKVTLLDGAILVGIYILLIIFIEKKNGILDGENSRLHNIKAYSYRDILKILAGVGIVIAASSMVVEKTLYFGDFLGISVFYISLIAVSIGTNMPELSLAIRSTLLRQKDIAMGDYVGSAAANTFLFGFFTLLGGGESVTADNFLITFIFLAISLLLFYVFSYKKGSISRNDGIFMLGIYLLFVVLELI